MTKSGLVLKPVEELPARQGGFGGGGGRAMDLSPIVQELQKHPGKWFLIEEGRKSLGSLQRLPVEFDVKIETRTSKTTYEVQCKDGKTKVGQLIDVYGCYEAGYSAGHVKKLMERAKERGTGFAANTLIHKTTGAQAPVAQAPTTPAAPKTGKK